MNIKPSVAGITIIALGTSVPDTFASRSAAMQDSHADAAIGNITGEPFNILRNKNGRHNYIALTQRIMSIRRMMHVPAWYLLLSSISMVNLKCYSHILCRGSAENFRFAYILY